MIRLLRAEILRLFSRRFTLVAMLIVLLGLGAFQIQVNLELQAPSASELAGAQSAFEQTHTEWEQNHLQWEKDCLDQGGSAQECATPEPTIADYLGERSFKNTATESLTLTSYLVALTMFMVAGSYIGAEFSSGSIANWLSFLPRRNRVFLAKLLTVTAFAVLVSAVLLTASLTVAVVAARAGDVPLTDLRPMVGRAARSVLPSLALAAIGFCIGLVARHTAAAIGVLLGYLAVWFVRNALLSEQTWAQRLTPWAPESNLAALVNKGYTYEVPVRTVTPDGVSLDSIERHLSLAHGITYWAVLLAVVVVGAGIIFRRRDVN